MSYENHEGYARLAELADHLLTGKLHHDFFDFGVFSVDFTLTRLDRCCGSAGCAMGEAAFLWPETFTLVQGRTFGEVGLIDGDANGFFGISEQEYSHLFLPCSQSIDLYGGRRLSVSASREDVARNILAFLEKKGYTK